MCKIWIIYIYIFVIPKGYIIIYAFIYSFISDQEKKKIVKKVEKFTSSHNSILYNIVIHNYQD